jgi:hypothetical protein
LNKPSCKQTNNKQQTTNNKQQTTNNKQQTTNNKQQTNYDDVCRCLSQEYRQGNFPQSDTSDERTFRDKDISLLTRFPPKSHQYTRKTDFIRNCVFGQRSAIYTHRSKHSHTLTHGPGNVGNHSCVTRIRGSVSQHKDSWDWPTTTRTRFGGRHPTTMEERYLRPQAYDLQNKARQRVQSVKPILETNTTNQYYKPILQQNTNSIIVLDILDKTKKTKIKNTFLDFTPHSSSDFVLVFIKNLIISFF